jgi:hypothetical protein
MFSFKAKMAAVGAGITVAMALILIPLTLSSDSGLQLQTVCGEEAGGEGCCFNPLAICDIGGNPYYQYENKSWIQVIFGCGTEPE